MSDKKVEETSTESDKNKKQPSASTSKLENYVKNILPKQQFSTYQEEIKKRFPLHKNVMLKINREKPPREIRNFLTARERRSLGFYKLPKSGMTFRDFLPMNQLWNDYATKFLQVNTWEETGFKGDPSDRRLNQIATNVFKTDLHGSRVRIVRSKCPSLVGIEGIVILETKHTLRVLGTDNRLRSVPKSTCVIALKIGNYELTLFGPNFEYRPAERSVRKIKTPLNIWL